MRNKSEFLKSFGTAFEVFKSLTDEVLSQGGADEDVRRILTDRKVRQEMVSALLKKAKQTVGNLYRLVVDYDRSFQQMIYHLNCGYVNSDITEKNFPSQESGSKEVEFILHHPNQTVSSDQVLTEMKNQGLRSATLKELAAFGTKYPDMQREFPIVALGSVWRGWGGGRGVPFLWSDSDGRDLSLDWYDLGWDSGFRFLSVRKS